MNLDRLTELRKRKIGLFNIRLTVSASPKARTPGMNQDTRRPSFEALGTLADLFDTTCDDLLGRTEKRRSRLPRPSN